MRSHDTKTKFKIERPRDTNYGATILTWDSFALVKKDIMLYYNPASVFPRAWYTLVQPLFYPFLADYFYLHGSSSKGGERTRRTTAL